MAEIDVDRGRGNNIWWWLLGLLVLAVILWALWMALGNDNAGTTTGAVDTTAPTAAPVVVDSAPAPAF